jgi:hypothetical protein
MTAVSKFTTPAAAGAEVSRRAARHMAETGCAYQEAMHVVLAADKQLAEAYAAPATRVRRMATTDPRSQPAVPVSAADEAEVRDWMLRALQDGKAGSLPGALGQLSIEAARFKREGMTAEEAISRAMGLFPHLVAQSKALLTDLRRNAPENKPAADGLTGLAQDKPGNPAGFAVHARAMSLMAEYPQMDYREAVGAVLSEDPALKTAYARS